MAVAPPWGIVLLRPGPPGPMPTFYTHLLGPLPPPGPPPRPQRAQGREGPTPGASYLPARVLRPSGAPDRSRQQPCQPPGTIRRPWDHPQPPQLPTR